MNLDNLPSHQKRRIEFSGFLTRGDIADLLNVTKECIKHYEREGILIPDQTNRFNTRLYKLETAKAFIQWRKTKSLPKPMVLYPQPKQESQDEIEWKNYLKELHS